MSVGSSWEALLRTDPRDAGCDRTRELLHVYVELVEHGLDAERELPGITAHLAACAPCEQDFQGLLTAVRTQRFDGPGA